LDQERVGKDLTLTNCTAHAFIDADELMETEKLSQF